MPGLPASGGPVVPPPESTPQAIYQRACQSCHGAEGQGQPGLYPPLAGVDWVTAPRPDRLIRIVLHGMVGPFSVNGRPFATPTPFMPGHAATLSDAEIANLLTWLRRSMGNDAPPVTPAAVTAIRTTPPERKSMWTAAELLKFPDR
jgi:mono/diheme cytochrome c family protein